MECMPEMRCIAFTRSNFITPVIAAFLFILRVHQFERLVPGAGPPEAPLSCSRTATDCTALSQTMMSTVWLCDGPSRPGSADLIAVSARCHTAQQDRP